MSIDSGPKAVSAPRTTTSRARCRGAAAVTTGYGGTSSRPERARVLRGPRHGEPVPAPEALQVAADDVLHALEIGRRWRGGLKDEDAVRGVQVAAPGRERDRGLAVV